MISWESMRLSPKLLALPAGFALACSLATDLSGLGGSDASSEDASHSDGAPPDSSAGDATVEDTGSDAAIDGGDASSSVVNVQIGPLAYVSTGGSLSPTLQVASTKGTLLVATLTCDSTTGTIGAPSGWTLAATGTGFATCSAILYAANNPGGITTATFTSTNGGALAAHLSEWSGVTTLDQTGTASTSSATVAVTVSTSAALAAGGELGITAFGQATGQQQAITYTPDVGWTAFGATATTRMHYTADYRIGVGPGTVSDSVTASLAATWSGVIATFK